jgi:hypothetical protein
LFFLPPALAMDGGSGASNCSNRVMTCCICPQLLAILPGQGHEVMDDTAQHRHIVGQIRGGGPIGQFGDPFRFEQRQRRIHAVMMQV